MCAVATSRTHRGVECPIGRDRRALTLSPSPDGTRGRDPTAARSSGIVGQQSGPPSGGVDHPLVWTTKPRTSVDQIRVVRPPCLVWTKVGGPDQSRPVWTKLGGRTT